MSTMVDNGDYPLERTISWQDIRDAPLLSSRHSQSDQGYIYVDSNNRKYRKPPVHFSVNITSIDGDPHKKTCQPGSTVSGYVQLNLDSPLAAQYLKLLFRATEHIYKDNNKKVRERLFSIRTTLWGTSSISDYQWPMLEPGKHRFQFLCELPLINYPPSFRHHLASCEFEFLASLERPGIRPFQTVPVFIRYQPLVLTSPLKSPRPHREETVFNNQTVAMILPKGCNYNINDYTHKSTMDVHLSFSQHTPINHIEAIIKREIHVSYGSYQQTDTMVMSHTDQSSFCLQQTRDEQLHYLIQVPMPTEHNKFNSSAVQRNFSVLGMTTSLVEHSKHTRIIYKLVITAKVRHGFLYQKRTLFSTILQIGTLPHGVQVPSNVVSYTTITSESSTSATRPRFLYVPDIGEEQLPAYGEEPSPPKYSSCHRN
ncbi:hypothetical protein RMATCC62417_05274 [Rhizopus microsporus]|nr:hypothetical protein RMATCC62417_05274 [Rhizopus microsporus]